MKSIRLKKTYGVLLTAILSVTVYSSKASALDPLDVPSDELAQESVYPVFDQPTSVKTRNIVTEGRFDFGAFWGIALTEPIYSVNKLGLNLNYHINEDHSLGLLFTKNSTGLSSYAKQLYDKYSLDFSRSPYPDWSLFIDWNPKFFYGKMSLTKQTVLNTTLYGSLAGGMVKYVHKSYPALAAGVGTRFYFTKNMSLKADLRLLAHNAPIPFLADRLKVVTPTNPTADPVPAYGDFNERLTYTTNLEIGLNWLF